MSLLSGLRSTTKHPEVNAFLVLFLIHFISTTTLSFFLEFTGLIYRLSASLAVARVRWDAARSGHLVLP